MNVFVIFFKFIILNEIIKLFVKFNLYCFTITDSKR